MIGPAGLSSSAGSLLEAFRLEEDAAVVAGLGQQPLPLPGAPLVLGSAAADLPPITGDSVLPPIKGSCLMART